MLTRLPMLGVDAAKRLKSCYTNGLRGGIAFIGRIGTSNASSWIVFRISNDWRPPMKALTLSAVLAAVAVMNSPTTASANVAFYRSIDEQLFDISAEARSLRWDIAFAPVRESDRRSWLRDMDDVLDEIADIHKSLLRGRSPEHLCREVGDLREEICKFRDELSELGQPTSYRFERGLSGSRVRCGVLTGGCVVPATFLARLNDLDRCVAALHTSIESGGRQALSVRPQVHDRHFDRNLLSPPLRSTPPNVLTPPQSLTPPRAPYAVPLPAPEHTSNDRRRPGRENAINTMQWWLSQLR